MLSVCHISVFNIPEGNENEEFLLLFKLRMFTSATCHYQLNLSDIFGVTVSAEVLLCGFGSITMSNATSPWSPISRSGLNSSLEPLQIKSRTSQHNDSAEIGTFVEMVFVILPVS